jgi:Flp pilus assembly protein TadD
MHGRYPLSLVFAGAVFALAGRRAAAQDILTELQAMAAGKHAAAGPLALVNCALGNLDEAVQWAEMAIEQRDPQVLGLKRTPMFESLRSHARYPELLRRMNLA